MDKEILNGSMIDTINNAKFKDPTYQLLITMKDGTEYYLPMIELHKILTENVKFKPTKKKIRTYLEIII